MKKTITIVAMILLFSYSISIAGKITKTYHFAKPEIISGEEYSEIKLENAIDLGKPGEPGIPYAGVNILLPQNEIISNVTLSFGKEINLGQYTVKTYARASPNIRSK